MKNHRHIQLMLAGAAACLMLGGCAGGVDLSAEEETAVAEYAAGLLLKYDFKYPDRLRPEEEVRSATKGEASQMYADRETSEGQEANEAQEGSGSVSGPVDSAANRDLSGRLLGAESPVTANLLGTKLVQTYPEQGGIYVLEASEGSDILVCEIALKNENADTITVDAISSNPTIMVSLKDSGKYPAFITMLPDDLTTYSGTLAPGEEKHLVVLTEIPAGHGEKIENVSVLLEKGQESVVLAEGGN